nr:hypothetical protein [Tanacetum cinerariifolium]
MVAPVISISSKVSNKSVGFSFPRVILIGSHFVKVPVTLEVRVAAVALPAKVLELDTHSSSEADPSESSPSLVSVAPMVSPFLCSDDSESDTEIPERHVSPTTSILEVTTASILSAPSAIEDIPIGRLYHTHPGGPCRTLTVKKSVRPLSSHRLALRYTPHHLDRLTSRSSSSHSSSDHSLSELSILGHSLFGHTPPDTTDADSSTPQRFVHPSLARAPRFGDSSSRSSARPSCKRCRSHVAIMTLSIHAMRALVPSRADLLPPRKRFRDSISPEDSVEDDIDTNVLRDIKIDATAVEVAVDRDVEARVDEGIDMEIDVGIDLEDEVEDKVESNDKGSMEVGVDMDARIDIPNCMLMLDAMDRLEQVEEVDCWWRKRAGLSDRTRSSERENLKVQALLGIERDRVDSLRRHMALSQEEFRQVRRDRDDTRRRIRRFESFVKRRLGFRP